MLTILQFPLEVLENIALLCACSEPDGPPQSLAPLLMTCKTIYYRLRIPPSALPYDCTNSASLWPAGASTSHDGNSSLWARIFRWKFNSAAIERRAYRPTLVEFAEQLVRNCQALQDVRRRVASGLMSEMDVELADTLDVIYLILCENEDDDMNRRCVEDAGTWKLIMSILHHGLPYQIPDSSWPVENREVSLVLWIAWFLSTRERLMLETEEFSDKIVERVLAFVLLTFRYPVSYLPPHMFFAGTAYDGPDHHLGDTFVSIHGAYPVAHGRYSVNHHFGRGMDFSPPPAALAARLLFFARRECYALHGHPGLAANREESIERQRAQRQALLDQGLIEEASALVDGRTGATKEDLEDWGRTDAGGTQMGGYFGDTDWARARMVGTQDKYGDGLIARVASQGVGRMRMGRMYEPGSMSGLFVGRIIMIPEGQLRRALIDPAITAATISEDILGATTMPLYVRFEEHVQYQGSGAASRVLPSTTTPSNPSEHMLNAWLPPYTSFRSEGNVLEARLPGAKWNDTTSYKTWCGQLEEHDRDQCPSCIWRENELRALRDELALEGVNMDEDSSVDDAEHQDDRVVDDSDSDSDDGQSSVGSNDTDQVIRVTDDEQPHSPYNIPECTGVRDIILTGTTDPKHAAAWGDFRYIGRVRLSDGLIGIVRTPANQRNEGGRMFFYGYLLNGGSAKNFVGNWRMAGSVDGIGRGEDRQPGWEGAFSCGPRPGE